MKVVRRNYQIKGKKDIDVFLKNELLTILNKSYDQINIAVLSSDLQYECESIDFDTREDRYNSFDSIIKIVNFIDDELALSYSKSEEETTLFVELSWWFK